MLQGSFFIINSLIIIIYFGLVISPLWPASPSLKMSVYWVTGDSSLLVISPELHANRDSLANCMAPSAPFPRVLEDIDRKSLL